MQYTFKMGSKSETIFTHYSPYDFWGSIIPWTSNSQGKNTLIIKDVLLGFSVALQTNKELDLIVNFAKNI